MSSLSICGLSSVVLLGVDERVKSIVAILPLEGLATANGPEVV